MGNLELTPDELQWLGMESSAAQPSGMQKCREWSPPLPNPKKIKTNNEIFVGDIPCTAISLSKGRNIVNLNDKIEISNIGDFFGKRKQVIHLLNKRTKSEFASITAEISSFLCNLISLKMVKYG
jgi:hypothetical protein